MVAAEVILIIVGVIFVIGSFFVTEKLSQQDLEQISLMSQADLKHIAQKQVKDVKTQVENSVEEIIDESLEITKRGLERETNNKIMAVSEYSDTVMENMNKTHNEIMFLYSMLNEKQSETAEIVGDLQKYVKQIRDFDLDNVMTKLEASTKAKAKTKTATKSRAKKKAEEPVESVELVEAAISVEAVDETEETAYVNNRDQESTENLLMNKNEQILLLHKEGKNEVEIAKDLDCGLGEVRLVLGLYHEA